jgi:hypothetical protein
MAGRVAQVLGLQILDKSGCPMSLAFGDMGKHETLRATDYSRDTPMSLEATLPSHRLADATGRAVPCESEFRASCGQTNLNPQ